MEDSISNEQKGISVHQHDGVISFKPVITRRPKDFEALFDGFDIMKVVSYVASPTLLSEYLNSYKVIELVAGSGDDSLPIDKQLKGSLKGRTDMVRELMKHEEEGRLRIYIPEGRIVHSKFYMLYGSSSNKARVIVGSANFTQNARRHQENYQDCWDLEVDSSILQSYEKDYESIRQSSHLFLETLRHRTAELATPEDVSLEIERWISHEPDEEAKELVNIEVARSLSASVAEAVAKPDAASFRVVLPQSRGARKRLERLLAFENPETMPRSAFLSQVRKIVPLPLMTLPQQGELLLCIGDQTVKRSASLPNDKETVNAALKMIEAYIETFRYGHSPNIEYVQSCVYEAILYMFTCPFAWKWMAMKQEQVGEVDKRGPRFLFIMGPTRNGKTTFLNFALRLIAGKSIEPLAGSDFTVSRVKATQLTGSIFPLVYDDISRINEEVVKNFWERWYLSAVPSPQVVVTTNRPLENWAKSRAIRLNFTTSFEGSMAEKQELNRIFKYDNRLFEWFAGLYLTHLRDERHELSDDELELGRRVLDEIYGYAGRERPRFFPDGPIDKRYDQDMIEFRNYIKMKNPVKKEEGNQITLKFGPDMEKSDVRLICSLLPASTNPEQVGATIRIRDAQAFNEWTEKSTKKHVKLSVLSLRRLWGGQ